MMVVMFNDVFSLVVCLRPARSVHPTLDAEGRTCSVGLERGVWVSAWRRVPLS